MDIEQNKPDIAGPRTDIAFATDDQRWAAVQARDGRADGAFLYAVASTGVYCRPSCPSRPARRANVSFYADADAAEAAGFRACMRCKPRDALLAQRQAQIVATACSAIAAAEQAPTLQQLADAAGVSTFHFHRLFKAHTGVTPKAWTVAHRAGRARQSLLQGADVTTALYDAGFNSSGRFYAAADAAFGMTPGRFAAGGAGSGIRFAVASTWLGALLVAASERGVCAVTLGDDADALVRALQDDFPQAALVGDDAGFDRLVATVVACVEEPARGADLPLDVRGTAFQQRVWQALRRIPSGTTLSYTQLAAAIGQPNAVRAVASACAANQIALLIPCHRVVRTDGSLSGYRWGVPRKQALLDRERVAIAPTSRSALGEPTGDELLPSVEVVLV